jgi:RND family efflux transporter MFP subunit
VDLEPLKIERKAPAQKVRSGRRRSYVVPIVALSVLVGLGWVFQRRVLEFVDGYRLPEVQAQRVTKSSAVAAASATGASANGYIVAKTRAALSADTPGRIVELNVQEGSVVKRGDIVARLYADEYAALLRRAEADVVLAQAGLERVEAQAGVVEADLKRLHAVERAAAADIAQYEAQLAHAQLSHDRAVSLLANQVGTVDRRDQTKSDLDAATARLTWSRAQHDAAQLGAQQGESQLVVARASLAEARANMDVLRAMRDQAQATLDKTAVRAPFDGIVVLKDAEIGEVVSPNVQGGSSARGSVVTMVDFASLEVQAEVPETSLAAVKVGARAQIYLDAFPDKPYPGRVDRIWPTANRTKATVEVRVAFDERDDRLRPEMGVRIVFQADGAPAAASAEPEPPVVLVPIGAVIKAEGKSIVFVIERDTVRSRDVTLGDQRAGRVVVRSGLSEGETIVADPPASLVDGDRVRLKGQ